MSAEPIIEICWPAATPRKRRMVGRTAAAAAVGAGSAASRESPASHQVAPSVRRCRCSSPSATERCTVVRISASSAARYLR